jgi:hypothetical protein
VVIPVDAAEVDAVATEANGEAAPTIKETRR